MTRSTREHSGERDPITDTLPESWTRSLAPDARDQAAGTRIARSWVATRRARAEHGARPAWSGRALAAAAIAALVLVVVPSLPGGAAQVDADALLRAYGDAMLALPLGTP